MIAMVENIEMFKMNNFFVILLIYKFPITNIQFLMNGKGLNFQNLN